jgi:RES domain
VPPTGRQGVPLDERVLADLEAEPLAVTVFRTSWIPPRGEADPLYTEPYTNRFGTAAGTVYTASSTTVAWAETCRNQSEWIEESNPLGVTNVSLAEIARFATTEINRLVIPRAVHELEFVFQRVVDLRTVTAQDLLEGAGMEATDLRVDNYGRCGDLAAAAVALGWQAILVPSAAWDPTAGFCVPVLKPAAAGALIRVERLAEAALPTLAVAHLTRYPEGHRPSWLP